MDLAPVICLMGATATGKTQLSLSLVEQFPFEIVSVDSSMIYRDMNIGTGKPTPEVLTTIPHHLIDICDPTDIYSAAQFREDALQAIQSIHQAGKIPLLVGGTMLYFKLLQQGIANLPSADSLIRERILLEAQQQGWEKLHQRLQQIDPISAARIHVNDPQRMQRALEVYELTGKSLTEHWQAQQTIPSPYRFINIALDVTRAELHQRIEQRFDDMLSQGLIDEVAQLLQRYELPSTLPSMKAVGYQQVRQYLTGEFDYATMREKAIIATRRLAKHQTTWLRSWPNVTFINVLSTDVHSLLAEKLDQ